jgi:para-nitrobenzyl esterase
MKNTVRLLIALMLIVAAGSRAAATRWIAAQSENRLTAGSGIAVVPTSAGAVQGFVREGIYSFRGIPYASAERFMPPGPVAAWAGNRFALSYGDICPQFVNPKLGEPQTFISDTHFWPSSEDCLNLNVWTPGLGATGKRPVMVWIHGGGFFSGSSMELPIYDGTRLSREGDVVIVSINHRLNVLGFLDLSQYGEKYRASANVGMLDIVAALKWVRQNIAAFGGDPGNVTVFGQSGGGAKVATLMTAPSAKGLFQKAIIESGAPGAQPSPYSDRAVSRRVAEVTLENLGLAHDVDKAALLPYEQLLQAAMRALDTVGKERSPARPPGPFGFGLSWAQVVDGDFLPEGPFAQQAPQTSRGVPLLIGSTLSEFQHFPNPKLAGAANWDEQQALSYLAPQFGGRTSELAAALRAAYPHMAPSYWPFIDTTARSAVLRTAAMKSAQGDPVYVYLFAWKSPILDGAWAAGHSMELPFVFNNAELGMQATGGGKTVQQLTRIVSRAWVGFARTGRPFDPALPTWTPYTENTPATMILDAQSTLRVGYDAELIRLSTH